MPEYRFFRLGPSGSIVRSTDAVCPDDAAALVEAKSVLKTGESAEVWQEKRYIGTVVGD